MKQLLTKDAKEEVLAAWWGLKLEKGKSLQQYVNKFWDLHLKANMFKESDFAEQWQQYCVGLMEDIHLYVKDQKPHTIVEVIYHSKVAINIFFSHIKRGSKTPEERQKGSHLWPSFKELQG